MLETARTAVQIRSPTSKLGSACCISCSSSFDRRESLCRMSRPPMRSLTKVSLSRRTWCQFCVFEPQTGSHRTTGSSTICNGDANCETSGAYFGKTKVAKEFAKYANSATTTPNVGFQPTPCGCRSRPTA
jgi:hypothetical protein